MNGRTSNRIDINDIVKIRKEIARSTGFTIFIAITLVPILLIFKNRLPFPYPQFPILCICVFVGESILFGLSINRHLTRFVYKYLPYFDILITPFLFWCTGGFMSPLIITPLLTVLASSMIYAKTKDMNFRLMAILIAGYAGVSLLQKYGYISNKVDYSNQLMQNSFYFYTIFTLNVVIITFSYFLFNLLIGNTKSLLDNMRITYQDIVESTFIKPGEQFFASMVKHIADTLKVPTAFIGTIDNKKNLFFPLATIFNGTPVKKEPFEIGNSIISMVLREKEYLIVREKEGMAEPNLLFPDNSHRSFLGITLKDMFGKPIGVLGIADDTWLSNDYILYSTMRIFAARATAEMERINADNLRKQVESQLAAAQKMDAIGRLAGGVSHDFKNTLMAIMNYCQLLTMKLGKGSPLAEYPKKIIDISQKAATLIRQLLTVARRSTMNKTQINIHTLVDEIDHIVRHTLSKLVEISVEQNAQRFIVFGDAAQLQNAILNLVINACDAMERGGNLILRTFNQIVDTDFIIKHPVAHSAKKCEYIGIHVSDTGIGMTEEVMNHLFEPFFTTKPEGKGTGLGLATVYGYVKAHDGFIDISSIPKQGSTFTIYIPLQEASSGMVNEPSGRVSEPTLI